MIDIKKELVEVSRLSLGMYITDLDRPWEGTPFMLQGFLLDDENDLNKLMSLCQHVYIDRTKSVAHHFAAPAKVNVSLKREGAQKPPATNQKQLIPTLRKVARIFQTSLLLSTFCAI
jgi:Domain of unknown function (DUF3391)